jgi:phosphoenolpyruvate carboxylase
MFLDFGGRHFDFEDTEQWDKVQDLYDNSLFFKTLLENSMMSITSRFPLTAYMKKDPEFGEFWQIIYDEFFESSDCY